MPVHEVKGGYKKWGTSGKVYPTKKQAEKQAEAIDASGYKMINTGTPLKFSTPEELKNKIEEYFNSCYDYKRDMFGNRIEDKECIAEVEDEKGIIHRKWKKHAFVMEQVKPFTVSGLASYLNTSRETLTNYEKRDEFFDTIKEAKDKIYAYTEESLFTSKPAGAIFSLINNYGWKNKQEIDNNVTVDKSPINELIESIDNIKNENK